MGDLVGVWTVPLSDGVHKVEFEHGTTSGKRVVRVDNKVLMQRDWMFKLVGREVFDVGKAKCVINIEPVTGFAYEYTLVVNGKPYEKFTENLSKVMKTWTLNHQGIDYRIVLEKDTLDLWANGARVEAEADFVEGGTETQFELCGLQCCLKAASSGNKRIGIVYTLTAGGIVVPEATE